MEPHAAKSLLTRTALKKGGEGKDKAKNPKGARL